ncbi:hypothetical protein FJT64_012813 [Amphibalanus amphitrite]|uniref:Ionotropic glutamate receptor L-glutamate and glycine-binding domain-containing protein n=1 Tax=Amphibalanus amphitrite TaxID=1232801 RepID=A0A6A4V537_AMPAM|nr:hypothetical protein FJT64_012813 [Amphibalanus amphitrite]
MERLGPWPNTTGNAETLVVATFDYPPFTFVSPDQPGVVTGYLKELLEILADEVGVSLVYDTNNTVGDFGVQRPGRHVQRTVVGMLLAAVLLRLTVSLARPRHPEEAGTFGVISSFLHVYACVVQQGWSSTPTRWSPWLVMMAARLMSYIVYVEYTATLEFVERSDWSLLMQRGVAYSSDWKVGERGYYQLRLEGLCRQFFLLGSKACDLVTLPMRPVTSNAEMVQAGHGRYTPVFLTMQKGLKIRPKMDRVMRRMYETGTVHRFYRQWYWDATTMKCHSAGTLRALSIFDISGMFLVMPAGG